MTFEEKTVVHALRDMFRGGTFYITTVRECLELTGAQPPQRDIDALSPLHCMKFRDMDPDYRMEVCQRILALFTHDGLPDFIAETFDLPATTLGEKFRLALGGSAIPALRGCE